MIERLNCRLTRLVIDAVIAGIALYLAYLARYDGSIPPFRQWQFLILAPFVGIGTIVSQLAFGIQKHKWRYVNLGDTVQILKAYGALAALLLFLRIAAPPNAFHGLLGIPMGVIAMQFMFSLFGALAVRVLRRLIDLHRKREKNGSANRRILLAGAGIQGVTLANELAHSAGIEVVGFVDDDADKIGSVIAGVPVLGPTSFLSQSIDKHRIDEVLLCVPRPQQEKLKRELSQEASKRTRVVPTLDDILSPESGLLTFSKELVSAQTVKSFGKPAAVKDYPQTLIRDKTIVITGGAGFIGSSLAVKLAVNNRVILVDLTFRHKPVEFTGLLGHRNVEVVEGNLLNGIDLKMLCCEADMVVHAAAIVGVSRVCHGGRDTLETNYVGTSRLLQALENSRKLQRLIYFSTSEVFGVNSFRVDENAPPSIGPIAEPRWSYAIGKLAGEHLVKAYSRELGMPVVIVRPFNVFGPKRTGEHAMMRFILDALSGKAIHVYGDGSQIRSWCYIEDFCSALLLMLERPEAVGEDFNIGNASNTITICELARKVGDLCGTGVPVEFVDHPFPDISIRVPSLTKAKSQLGYAPRYDLNSALGLTVDWYREHLDFFQDPLTAAYGLGTNIDPTPLAQPPQSNGEWRMAARH